MNDSTNPTKTSAESAAAMRPRGDGAAAGSGLTPASGAAGPEAAPASGATPVVEVSAAALGFCLALMAYVLVVPGRSDVPALLLVALLAAGYFAFSIRAVRDGAAARVPDGLAGALLGPAVLWAAAVAYAAVDWTWVVLLHA